MKTHTVNQSAPLAGILVRALQHYDETGLLKPAFTGDNRDRYYGEEELLRLQQSADVTGRRSIAMGGA